MLEYYTLMRTKNKMDSEVESTKWWEVGCKGIFYKGVGEEFDST